MEEFRHNTDSKRGTGKEDERKDGKAKQRLLTIQQLYLMKTQLPRLVRANLIKREVGGLGLDRLSGEGAEGGIHHIWS